MQGKQLYEYAVVRLVPRVEREEFLNVGVVLFSAAPKFLCVRFDLDEKRIHAFSPHLDILEIRNYLESFERICKGAADAGPIGLLPIAQRFRWLTAVRSTMVQMSKVHTGLCSDPADRLLKLFEQLVLEPV